MAGIDKIYGTQKQYNELRKWLKNNPISINCCIGSKTIKGKDEDIFANERPLLYLYPVKGYSKDYRPISNFPHEIDEWLLKSCPINWVIEKIKEQYNIK